MRDNNMNFKCIYETLSYILPLQLINDIKKIPATDLSEFHFGLGTWLRNNFLAEGSRFYLFLRDKGCENKDEMSMWLLEGFYEHLKL